MSTVAITGARGFVGRYAVHAFEAAGNDVVRIGRDDHGHLHRIDGSPSDPLFADVDRVVHLAGILSLGPDSLVAEYLDANVALTERVVLEAIEAGATSVVLASSRLVYPASLARPAIEADAQPDTAYGMSKWFAERTVAYHGVRAGVSTVSLRLAQLVGPGGSGRGVLPSFVAAGRRGGPIRIQGSGSAVRDFLDVRDAAHALVLASEPGAPGRVFNIGSGGRSIADLASIAAATMHLPESAIERTAAVHDDTSHWSLDSTAAAEELGWTPTHSVADIIRELERDEGSVGDDR